mgnify:CR=1 FL=1
MFSGTGEHGVQNNPRHQNVREKRGGRCFYTGLWRGKSMQYQAEPIRNVTYNEMPERKKQF